MVQDPGFLTFTSALVRIAWSRSVAVIFNRSPSASIRKFDRIGMVVLRSTTLCVAVSSLTRSWRLTVISIVAPCAAGFSTSVSTIGIGPPLVLKARSCAGHTLQHFAACRKRLTLLLLDCIHLCVNMRVENVAVLWIPSTYLFWSASSGTDEDFWAMIPVCHFIAVKGV